jgi:hypothetical protein
LERLGPTSRSVQKGHRAEFRGHWPLSSESHWPSSQVIPAYNKDGIKEEQHYKHIDDLIAYANSVGEKVLGKRGYKYGVAQKLLNLVLKYHWCLGTITEPPHCPVDRIVVDKTRYRGEAWTKILQRSDYQKIIDDIKRLAGTQSVAMWELSIFSRR